LAATLTEHGHAGVFLHPAEAIHGDLGVIQGDDVIVALSNGGETGEILRLLDRSASRRKTRGDHWQPVVDAGAGGRRRAQPTTAAV